MDAAGQRKINESANTLSAEQIAMQLRLALLKHLPDIIKESVRPTENIDGIKIIQVEGFNGGSGASEAGAQAAASNLADQVVSSALRYRAQAPLIESLLSEVGLSSASPNGLTRVLRDADAPGA